MAVSDTQVEDIGALREAALEPATVSRGFVSWLIRHKVALACTCPGAGQVTLIGSGSDRQPIYSRARFPRPMGLTGNEQRIYLAAARQIWRFENALEPGKIAAGRFDRVYAPRASSVTGDVDAHEIAVEGSGRVVFANTAFSCLAVPSATHAFKPVWKPRFISKLVPEDRCHLNGVALEGGKAAIVSVCAMTDAADGWRARRDDGGALIEIETNRVLVDGLSMPHSPRARAGALWALESGTGHLLRIDRRTGAREAVMFSPGFLRGLAFVDDFAIVGQSLPRQGRLQGLALEANIERTGVAPWCGLLIVDLRQGAIVEWLHFGDQVREVFDVVALGPMRAATAVGVEDGMLEEMNMLELGSLNLRIVDTLIEIDRKSWDR